MKKVIFTLLVCIIGTAKAQNWQLVWADEFSNGISQDWVFETGRGGSGWGNNELQYYRRENATVENGNLVITAKRENFGGANYTSARMKTQGKKSWKYGRMEARIAMPSFTGVWPAFWMLGDNISTVGWPNCGEIDVMEHINTNNTCYGTIHWSDQNGNYANYGGNIGTNVTQYHVYAVEWDESKILWFRDGVKYHEVNIAGGINGTSEFHNKYFLLLNMAIGGNWPGFSVDNNAFPAKMLVDYVRVYTWTNTPPPTGNVTVYKHCNYGGTSTGLGVGDYNLGQLQARGIANDDISSIKVGSGYEAILFWDDNFQGSSITVKSNNSCLVDVGWNDKVSSLKIRTSGSSFSKFIEAEQFSAMNGVQTEPCAEGGQNVGYIDAGDWMAYNNINFPSSGTYKIEYRVASPSGSQLSADLNAGSIQLGTVGIPSTGGWQNWTTVSHNVYINAGTYNFGLFAPQSGWNINWIRITNASGGKLGSQQFKQTTSEKEKLKTYPNPAEGELNIVDDNGDLEGGEMVISNSQGRIMYQGEFQQNLNIIDIPGGIYYVKIITQEGVLRISTFLKQ